MNGSEELVNLLLRRDERIAALEAENKKLREALLFIQNDSLPTLLSSEAQIKLEIALNQ